MTPDLQSRPRLAPGCRLGENNNQQVLLMPERALRLNGPSLEIVQRCDGSRTVQGSCSSRAARAGVDEVTWKARAAG